MSAAHAEPGLPDGTEASGKTNDGGDVWNRRNVALGHIGAFDFIRGPGSHFVVITHLLIVFLGDDFSSRWWLFTMVYLSHYVLLCFFIVSGFVIAHSLFSYRDNATGFDEHRFFANRVARIYPPLLAALVLELACYALIQGGMWVGYNSSFDFRGIFSQRLYETYPVTILGTVAGYNGLLGSSLMPMNGPLWSLGYELWIYWLGMFGFVFWFGASPKAIKALIAIAVTLGVARIVANFNLFLLALIWLYGFLGYVLVCRTDLSTHKLETAFAMGFFIAVAAIALKLVETRDFVIPAYSPKGLVARLIVCFPLACLLVRLSYAKSTGLGILSRVNAVTAWMASHSYTIYVIHFPLVLTAHYLVGQHLRSNVSVACAVLMSYLLIVIAASKASRTLEDSARFRKAIQQYVSVLARA